MKYIHILLSGKTFSNKNNLGLTLNIKTYNNYGKPFDHWTWWHGWQSNP